MSDLMKALEAWAEQTYTQTIEDDAKPYGWTQVTHPRLALDMLDLLRPLIEAADEIQAFQDKANWDQQEWVQAQHRMHDALADLRAKLGAK